MKRTNAPPIPEGLRIELNGEQEWTAVMQVFEKQGWRWLSGVKPHEKQTCAYKTIETTKYKRITINASVPTKLTAAQFLQQYQGTIEYEVGDWVVLLKDQSGDPEGTITQIIEVVGSSVDVKNITKPETRCKAWSATICSIRPATPEEIASVTKVEPVAVKKPEPYIWDGDVLPDEYWVENPWPNEGNTEFVELFDTMRVGNGITGVHRWYHVKNSKRIDSHNYSNANTELPIVPYELWKQILTTPDNQVKQPAGRKWKVGDTFSYKNNGKKYTILKEENDKVYVETPIGGSVAYKITQVDELWEKDWIPYSESKEKEDNTIISKQTKTKQNEKGNSISITEQCIVISSNYINYKTSNATYVPGDEERITKGQRRQGSTVRG
jgi:hypothetical protein